MKTLVVVREFARLTTCAIETSLDRATVPQSAFDYLCGLASQFRAGGAQLLQVEGRQWLRLDNYVGIIETPCGTILEILPKHVDAACDKESARELLARMIQASLNLPVREAGPADISLFKAPLSEWVRHHFLSELESLVKCGIKFFYMRVEEEQRHLRGQLDVVRQLRQPPHRSHYFHTRHDVYSLDSPENRLIKAALVRVASTTENPHNWRVSHELLQILCDIPTSLNFALDFRSWRDGRLMAHYASIRQWCQLVLGQHQPVALSGCWHGMSVLFPMEKLFERFVEAVLKRDLKNGVRFIAQSRSEHLCLHQDEGFFQLRPDIVLEEGRRRFVLDTKWKRLNSYARDEKYGIAQSDFYQLFAYGRKYMAANEASKELVLIYPRTANFLSPLPPFAFEPDLTLRILPFDLGARAGEEQLIVPQDMQLAGLLRTPPRPLSLSAPAAAR